ncbi:MAG: hypothetical protein LBT95_08370 [Treponema sp.]|jgi:hypothetical protein|nr:hypothetical protein [Treponema sp.]
MKGFFVFFLVIIAAVLFSGCAPDSGPGERELGVWWWHSELIGDRRYLDFAVQNKVEEIYLCTEDFSGETEDFVQEARAQGIRVYLLAGDYTYIEDDGPLQELLRLYQDYQNRVSETRRFAGVHLDIEPHQHPQFASRRAEILAEYLALIMGLQNQMPVEIDIPFWFDDPVPYKGGEKPLYQALIDTVNRVFVMSYRDTAAKMYEVAQEEIGYAASLNKPLMLGAELSPSGEGDQVSYAEEGKAYLYSQLEELLTKLPDVSQFGVAIHHIASWYGLKD